MKKSSKQFEYDIANIQHKVIEAIEKPIKTLEELQKYFMLWWCRHYNKPYKCPEVLDYTLEELIFEYFDILYRSDPEALAKFKAGNTQTVDEDEEWLQKVAGDGYMTKVEMEEALKSAPSAPEELPAEFKDDEFAINFDDIKE